MLSVKIVFILIAYVRSTMHTSSALNVFAIMRHALYARRVIMQWPYQIKIKIKLGVN